MLARRFRSVVPLLVVLVVVGLFVGAGSVLYRLIDRAAAADRADRKQRLELAMGGVRREFSEVCREAFTFFRLREVGGDVEPYVADTYRQLRSVSRHPGAIGNVYVASRTAGFDLRRLAQGAEFETVAWPTALEPFRGLLETQAGDGARRMPFGRAPTQLVVFIEDKPVVVVPLIELEAWRSDAPRPGEGGPVRLAGICFLELNPNYLIRRVLAEALENNFGGDSVEYELAVVVGDPWRPLYRNVNDFAPTQTDAFDATVALFRQSDGGPRPGEGGPRDGGPRDGGRRREWEGGRPPRFPDGDHRRGPDGGPERGPEEGGPARGPGRGMGPPDWVFAWSKTWLLVTRHRGGSLDAAVAGTRRRNLALGFGGLTLAFVCLAGLAWTVRRERALARRQMEFVAGVSHELRTPLAVIQSAGFNLSRGKIPDPERVKRYGEVIQAEGRRLSAMVEQILGYAGIQAGRERYNFAATPLGETLRRIVAEFEPDLTTDGWTVEVAVPADLPEATVDVPAFESMIRNLIQNAAKYAASGKWLRVAAETDHRRGRNVVRIAVADRGPGIDRRERGDIFEPFYRGRHTASAVSGAGLGLSLVQRHARAHGGRVTVENTPGGGATFVIEIPTRVEGA